MRAHALALALFFLAPSAHAVEKQQHIALAPMLAFLKIDGKSTLSVGGGAELQYSYGLTDQLNLTASASHAIVARNQGQDTDKTPRDRPAAIGQASAGLTYVLDILRWVPWGGVEGGLYWLTGGTLPSAILAPGGSVALGLDYQFTRHLALGVEGREHFVLTHLDTYPSYTTALLRFAYMWGW